MAKLTNRSKIAIRWTTAPADLGYGGKPTDWLNSSPTMRSPKNAVNFGDELNRKVGQGVFRRINYKLNGEEIDINELIQFVAYQ
jgi:hypothetical protein